MAGHALAAVQRFDQVVGNARLDGLADQAVRPALVLAVDFDVAIDMNLGHLNEAGS
jgi:hypothetical protein